MLWGANFTSWGSIFRNLAITASAARSWACGGMYSVDGVNRRSTVNPGPRVGQVSRIFDHNWIHRTFCPLTYVMVQLMVTMPKRTQPRMRLVRAPTGFTVSSRPKARKQSAPASSDGKRAGDQCIKSAVEDGERLREGRSALGANKGEPEEGGADPLGRAVWPHQLRI